MDSVLAAALVLCWATVVVVWIVGALWGAGHGQRPPIRGEVDVPTSVAAFLASAFVLIVVRRYAHGFTVSGVWIQILGLVVLLASTGFAVWARLSLGSSWSVGPIVGGDRTLRTSGPYGVTRHPIYTGLLGMLLGSCLIAGVGQWIVLVLVGLIGIEAKILMEERLLLRVFPDEYRRYRERVPQLIPGMRLAGRG
jgi:protein-S-isoprenylcysteine O-methyltransferase Ste14